MDSFLEMSTDPSDFNDEPVGFQSVMETDVDSGNLSVPRHMVQKTHSFGRTFSIL